MNPSLLTFATDSAAWDALEESLSVQELRKLSRLQAKIAAVLWFSDHHQPVNFRFVKRLLYVRWLVDTKRLKETLS